MPVGMRSGEIESPVQRRRVVLGSHARGLAVARRAARGVEPHRVDVRMRSDARRRESWPCRGDRDRIAERREVVGGDRRRHLVGVDGVDPQAERGEAERVAADPAAEVGDRSDAGIAEPAGVPRGDREPGRLLEAGAGEQHPLGELAELRARSHAQPRLPDDRRDQFGGVPGLAQARHRAGDIGGGVDGRRARRAAAAPRA